jgi:acetyltransferase
MQLDRLFDPGGIAVIGASATAGKLGHQAMRSAARFDGPVYPVNPNGEGELFGERFRPSVGAIDGPVDLALLAVPPAAVPEVLEECGEAGLGAAIVYAGGFAETDAEGAALQAELAQVARDHGLAVLGPNTSGYAVPSRQLFLSFASPMTDVGPGNLAVIAQSGGVAHTAAFQGALEGLGFSAVVGLGNRAVTGFEPVVEYFDADPATDAILLHVEGADDARGLLESCRAAETPIAALHVGQADVDEFAASHTGALTGDHALYEAGFRQYGVQPVETTAELLDAGHVLADAPVPAGQRVGVVTAQAGPGLIIADRLRAAGLSLPSLADETLARLEELLPGITYIENPVDTARPIGTFDTVIETVADDPNIDALIVYQLYEPPLEFPVETLGGLAEQLPVVFASSGPTEAFEEALVELRAAGVPAFRSPERGADALRMLIEHAQLVSPPAAGVTGD